MSHVRRIQKLQGKVLKVKDRLDRLRKHRDPNYANSQIDAQMVKSDDGERFYQTTGHHTMTTTSGIPTARRVTEQHKQSRNRQPFQPSGAQTTRNYAATAGSIEDLQSLNRQKKPDIDSKNYQTTESGFRLTLGVANGIPQHSYETDRKRRTRSQRALSRRQFEKLQNKLNLLAVQKFNG